MTTEAEGISRERVSTTQNKSRHALGEVLPQHSAMPDAVYRTILGTERPLRRKPEEYNIGELSLEPVIGLDLRLYDQRNMTLLNESERTGNIETGVPYIASGIITINDEQQAILKTATLAIHLGQFGPHAQRMFTTHLAGHEMVLPLMIDSMVDGEAQARVGEKAAYLIPNPDRKTRRRLRRIQGRAVVEGTVREVDHEQKAQMVIQTTKGTDWFPGEKSKIILDNGLPLFNQGTGERPTTGEPVVRLDTVRVPVEFVGRKMFMAGDASLIAFSVQHEAMYKEQRHAIEENLKLFSAVVTESDTKKITRLDGSSWDIADSQMRGAAARYLFAEIRQKERQLTPPQQEQLWKLFYTIEPDVKPFAFGTFGPPYQVDPRRQVLDEYFRQTTPEGELPRLSEAMTPEQLLDELIYMAANDDYPLPFSTIVDLISDYEEQFDKNAGINLLQQVIVAREAQLRGDNPQPAVASLLEVLPFMKDIDVVSQTEWLAHFIYAGIHLTKINPEQWNNSSELYQVMSASLTQLESLIYPDDENYAVNYDSLFTIYPFFQYMKEWPTELPYGLGEDASLAFILRDLKIMNETRKRVYTPEVEVAEDVLELVADGLKKM